MNEKSRDKIQKIIEASGNNFHSNVISLLREKQWNVLISPYYNDYASDKAREIDIKLALKNCRRSLDVKTRGYGPDNPHPLSTRKTGLVWEWQYDEYGNRRKRL